MIFKIEVEDKMAFQIVAAARAAGQTSEKYIEAILKRFAALPHIVDSEDIKKGYEESGAVNLEIANL